MIQNTIATMPVESFETLTQESHENISYGACVDWNHWNSYLEILRVYARVFATIDAFKEKRAHAQVKSFNKATLKPLTALNFAKGKQFLIQQMQSECYD